MYFIAVAGSAGSAGWPGSVVLDCSDELFKDRAEELHRQTRQQLDEAFAWYTEKMGEMEKAKIEAQTELARKREELAAIHESRGWKLVLKLRGLRDRLARLKGNGGIAH